MAYKVLSLKWRPQTFEDVVGQEHVTQTLINAFKQDRIAQGYIFTGPRGVGKTTTARILAMALNAENGPTSEFDPKSEIALEKLLKEWERFLESGLLIKRGSRYCLSDPKGMELSNQILASMFKWWEKIN